MIEQFCVEHCDYHGLTPGRRMFVTHSLTALSAFTGRPPELTTEAEFEGFLRAELARGLKATTVRQAGRACKPFFRWAWRRGHIDSDRFLRLSDVPMPRLPADANLPRPYSRRELDQFWEAFDVRWPLIKRQSTYKRWLNGTAQWRRVWRHAMRLQIECILHLALHCGMRRTEIWNATIDNIHYDNEWVVVPYGKGGLYREIPHTEGSRKAVFDWIEMRTDIAPLTDRPWLSLSPWNTPNNALWPDRSPHGPMREERFGRLLATVPGHGAGDKYWEYHRMRHTCATEWLRAGMELIAVSRYLGHSSVAMTERYTQIVRTDIARAAEPARPAFEIAVGRRKETNAHT